MSRSDRDGHVGDGDQITVYEGVGPDMDCPYLDDRVWRNQVLMPEDEFEPGLQEALFDRGYRRMGQAFFLPVCPECTECRSMRIAVGRFRRSKSQRRIWNRNADLEASLERVEPKPEFESLLIRYLERRHVDWEADMREEIVFSVLGDLPDNCRASVFRQEGRLLGVGITTLATSLLSSDYFFFDPDEERRSLGTYSMLWEIEQARALGLTWYHPGFYVAGCGAMSYKARLRPAEVLDRDLGWRELRIGAG